MSKVHTAFVIPREKEERTFLGEEGKEMPNQRRFKKLEKVSFKMRGEMDQV